MARGTFATLKLLGAKGNPTPPTDWAAVDHLNIRLRPGAWPEGSLFRAGMPILTYDVAAGTVTSLGFQDRLYRLPAKEDDCFLAVGYRPAGGIVDAADAPSLKDVLGRGIGTQQKSYVGLTAEEYRLLSNALQASPHFVRVERGARVTV